MEYKLDPAYLERKNQSTHMILILSCVVFFLICFIASGSYLWFAPVAMMLLFALWLRKQHNTQMAQVDSYRLLVHDGKLVYEWPQGYSEIKQGDLVRLETKTNSKQELKITLVKADKQIIALEGFHNMTALVEHIRHELNPNEVSLA